MARGRPVQGPRVPTRYDSFDVEKKARHRLKPASLKAAKRMWEAWVHYRNEFKKPAMSPLGADALGEIQKFIHWHVNHSNIRSLDSALGTFKQWTMAYYIKHGTRLDKRLTSEMTSYIRCDICETFDLSQTRSDKAVMNADDQLVLLHYHWTQCKAWYPIERLRVQDALTLLIIVYTGVRPAAILEVPRGRPKEEAEEYDDLDFLVSTKDPDARPDCLKYKDIELYKVKSPDGQHAFLMIITFRLMKNTRNRGLPHKVVFHERDDNLAFCPILLILSIALTDRAFKSDWLREPADLFDFEVVEDRGMLGIPLEWRDDIREVPVMREVEKAVCGYETSSHRGLRYDTARCALVRLGRAVGLKDPLHFYTGRRGFGEAVDSHLTAAVRNRAMGHRSEVYDKFYTNQVVNGDTMSAFLGTASANWTIRLASHLSLTRDPYAQQCVPQPSEEDISSNSDVRDLEKQIGAMRIDLMKCGSIQAARRERPQDTVRYDELQRARRALRKKVGHVMYEEKWRAWFANVGTEEIGRQRTQNAVPHVALAGELEFEERRQLSALLFRNDDVSILEPNDVQSRRLRALVAMTSLCSRQSSNPEPRKCKSSRSACIGLKEGLIDPIQQDEDLYKARQCPWCFSNGALSPRHRFHSFAQVVHLRRHVERTHLRQARRNIGLGFRCPYDNCLEKVGTEEMLKNHLARTHGFYCSAGKFDRDAASD